MKRLETTMEVSYATMAMSNMLVAMVAWCHIQACLWGMLPQFEEGQYTWISAFNESHYDMHGEHAAPLGHWDLYV
eukprot:7003060-Prymnesium_polylepis.1